MSDYIQPEHYIRYIPEEIVEQILSWLPAVDLIRSTLVCKLWRRTVQNKDFLKLHRTRSHNNRTGIPKRYIQSPQRFPQQEEEDLLKDRFTLHSDDALLSITEEFDHPFISTYFCDVVGCCNGVFLLSDIDYRTFTLILWNPSIRRYSVIPTKDLEQEEEIRVDGSQEFVLGIYYSASMDDYRVVLLFNEFYYAPAPEFVRIYSHNTRTWLPYTKAVPRYQLFSSWSQVLVHGALHWCARDSTDWWARDSTETGHGMIVSFKLNDEVFCCIPLPPNVVNHRVIMPVLFNGCLAICANNFEKEIQLWVMSDYGNTETWTFVVKLRTPDEDSLSSIAFRLTTEHSVECFYYSQRNEELACYNCDRNESWSVGISCCDPPKMGICTDSMGLYSENRYMVMSNEDTDRSGRFIAELVKLCLKMVSVDDLAGLEDASFDYEDDNYEAEPADDGTVGEVIVEAEAAAVRKPYKNKAWVDSVPRPLMEGEGRTFRVLGFSPNQRTAFVQILMRFGVGEFNWAEFTPRLKQKTLEEIDAYGKLFLAHIAEDITDSPTFSDGVPKEGLRIQDVLVRIAVLHLIRDKIKNSSKVPSTPLFSDDIIHYLPGLRCGRLWKEEHDLLLLRAVLKHGYGRWLAIVEDKEWRVQELICKELNPPFINLPNSGSQPHVSGVSGSLEQAAGTGGSQAQGGNVSGTETTPHYIKTAVGGNGSGPEVAQGAPDGTNGSQIYQDPSSVLSHFREMQRRQVDFIKKRVLLLEKALKMEHQTEVFGDEKSNEIPAEHMETESKVADIADPNVKENKSLPKFEVINKGENEERSSKVDEK